MLTQRKRLLLKCFFLIDHILLPFFPEPFPDPSRLLYRNREIIHTLNSSSFSSELIYPSFVPFAKFLVTSSLHQFRCWGGTLAVLMILSPVSTRKRARILRYPDWVSSKNAKGATRCFKIMGNVRSRPSRQATDPTSCTAGPLGSSPKTACINSCSALQVPDVYCRVIGEHLSESEVVWSYVLDVVLV